MSTNNTFEELIGNIALGKKWATGVVSNESNLTKLELLNTTNKINVHLVHLPPLEFVPSLIIGSIKSSNNKTISITIIGTFGGEVLALTSSVYNDVSGGTGGALKYKSPLKLDKNASVVCIPIINEVRDFYWYAFE